MTMNQDQFEKEFTDGLFYAEDRLEIKQTWERRAQKAGLELPKRGDMPLARYVWEVRAIVVKHHRAQVPRPAQVPKEDTVTAIERCRMIVQPHGQEVGCDHEWFAVASILDDDGSEVDTIEGDGQTLAEAVAMCARLYDEACAAHASETK